MVKKNRSPVARLLREARARLGISQYELAKTSGVARITIAGLELGKNAGMRTGTAHKLATALGLPPSAFMDAGIAPKATLASFGPEQLLQQLGDLPANASMQPSAQEASWLRQMLAHWGESSPPTVASTLLLLLARRAGEKSQRDR